MKCIADANMAAASNVLLDKLNEFLLQIVSLKKLNGEFELDWWFDY